jgi:short-subunit dehydrogenase
MATNKKGYALITGGSGGFGYEFAQLCAKDGYNLVLVARNKTELDRAAVELKDRYQVDVITIAKDLFNDHTAMEIYEEAKARQLQVDILINNAGQGEHGMFSETDLQRDLDLIQLNVVAPVVLTKLFLKDMLARGEGKILQVSSLLGQAPTPLMAVYGGTKAFVLKFSEAVINELKDTGVTMTVLQPGASDTDFFHKAGAESTKEYQESSLSDPADVAKDGYEALMSGESRIISGAKNKMMAAMTNVMPDSMTAANLRKHMEQSDERNRPIHGKGEGK